MKKLPIFTTGILVLTSLTASVYAATFTDVGDGETYKAGIEFLASLKVINGNPDGTYKPEKVLNRAEMIKIIAEGAATYYDWPANVFDDYAGKKCFNDVEADQWYTKYICYGKEKGWVKGYDGNLYKPNQEVTFAEGLKITFMGFDLGYTENVSIWYKDVVVKASEKNFIPFTIKAFNTGLKRNEMADMVTRIIKSDESDTALDTYLGIRANVVVTYETIEKGEDLSKMDVVEVGPGENENEEESQDIVTHLIEMSDIGFSPSSLTINAGDTVTFTNSGTASHWPASAVHPTHTTYPGSGVEKCGTGEEGVIFDACKSLKTGESWSFKFTEKGEWSFHDHLNSSFTGKIVVK